MIALSVPTSKIFKISKRIIQRDTESGSSGIETTVVKKKSFPEDPGDFAKKETILTIPNKIYG